MPIFLPRLLVKDTAIITSSINPFNSFTTRNNKSSRARLGSWTHYASYESDSTNQFYYQANEPQWQTLRTIVNFTSNRQSASQFHQSVQPPYSSLNSTSTFSTFMKMSIIQYPNFYVDFTYLMDGSCNRDSLLNLGILINLIIFQKNFISIKIKTIKRYCDYSRISVWDSCQRFFDKRFE